jgi:hypothetical protein
MMTEEKYLKEKVIKRPNRPIYSQDTNKMLAQMQVLIDKYSDKATNAKMNKVLQDLIDSAYADGFDNGYESAFEE